jgi:hypothetical protein
MRDAFGVERVAKAKKEPQKRVPDWAKAAMPASAADAYDNSRKKKVKAGGTNWALKSGSALAASTATAGGMYILARKGKLPAWFNRSSTYSHIPIIRKTPFTVHAGEKQRYLGSTVAGTAGTITGGFVGQKHLKHVQDSKQYDYRRPK